MNWYIAQLLAGVVVFAVWLIIEFKNVKRWMRIAFGSILPIFLIFIFIQQGGREFTRDKVSAHLLSESADELIKLLEAGENAAVFAALHEAEKIELKPPNMTSDMIHRLHAQLQSGSSYQSSE
jgi:hypothetical protein